MSRRDNLARLFGHALRQPPRVRRVPWLVRYLFNALGACALLVACASAWLILDRLEGLWR